MAIVGCQHTVNIPGAQKNQGRAWQLLRSAVDSIVLICEEQGWRIWEERLRNSSTGPEALVAIEGDHNHIKLCCVNLEESSRYGRLLDVDVDVVSKDGSLISRDKLHLRKRRCFICPENAVLCVRSR